MATTVLRLPDDFDGDGRLSIEGVVHRLHVEKGALGTDELALFYCDGITAHVQHYRPGMPVRLSGVLVPKKTPVSCLRCLARVR